MTEHPDSFMALVDHSQDYRWPKKGDRLLQECQDWHRSVDFSNDAVSRHVFIWGGNKKAADILIETCREDSHGRYSLIYPILFNYRHAIELAMKWIISMYGRYSTAEIKDIEHHNLWKLWCLSKQIIVEVGSESDAIPIVEQVIKDLHDLDSSGQAFRYPSSKAGAPIALPKYMVDLPHIRDVMEGVDNFFSGVDGQLSHNSSAVDW